MLAGRSQFTADDDEEGTTQRLVLAHPGGVPPLAAAVGAAFAAAAGGDFVGALLQPRPPARLGSAELGGGAGVQRHAWLAGVDWDGLLAMRVPAPRLPPPLDVDADEDAALAELTRRCQQGFD